MAVTLSIDASIVRLHLRVRYLEVAGYWIMTIRDQQSALLIDSLPLVTGYYPAANLLQQYAYLAIGSAYLLNVSGTDEDSPDSTNLGSSFLLVWDDTPDF
jgi:hypothetical protein